MNRKRNNKTKEMLQELKWNYLLENWNDVMMDAEKEGLSYDKFMVNIIKKEFDARMDLMTHNRIKRSKIPNSFTIESYPFEDQPHLNKKRFLQNYDSLDYVEKKRNIIFIGPTGTGKTGLASSILRHALNQGHTGRFVSFSALMDDLLGSIADQSSKKIIQSYVKYECLVIDDLAFVETEKTVMSLFYTLIQKRYKKSCTIITTMLGFTDWNCLFDNNQLTDALLSRLTDDGHIINLKKCNSIRQKPDVD